MHKYLSIPSITPLSAEEGAQYIYSKPDKFPKYSQLSPLFVDKFFFKKSKYTLWFIKINVIFAMDLEKRNNKSLPKAIFYSLTQSKCRKIITMNEAARRC